jgi:TRAP-type C4-dicarboxylate transport system permease small subunit
MRRALDGLYAASGALAVLFLILIAVLTLSQVIGRVLGVVVPSADDFAGFCMAGAVFLGMTYTLRSGGHVRVRTLLTHVGLTPRRGLEILCAVASVVIIGALLWYAVDMTLVTRRLGEFTLGLIPVPKWIPMILMVTGLAIFLVALIDDMVQLLRGGKATYIVREEVSEASIPAGAE